MARGAEIDVGTRENFKATITRAFAATVVDASTSGEANEAPRRVAKGLLPGVGDLVGGHYRLVRLLGEGMFGRVYVAERIDVPAHQVALKLVPREVYSGRNVERELVMLAAASHPNIVQLKDHGTTADYVWLTMPVYEGETLADRIHRGPLTLAEAHEIFLPVARALDALHKAGLRHQDIKPENIFLATFAGRLHPILLDLGVAAERDAPFVAGTILYASPEQLVAFGREQSPMPLSEKMDTYCLAATLLAALVGPDFFPGEGAETRLQIAEAHSLRNRRPLSPAALPGVTGRSRELLSAALCRWLDPDPSRRPYVSEMADELDVLLEPQREAERKVVRRAARARSMRRAAAALVLGLGAVGAIYAYSKRKTLELASELEQARAIGAESFTKLDTCVATYKVSEREAQTCREGRGKDRTEFRSTLDRISRSGTTTQADHAREIQELNAACTTKITGCEESAANVTRACALDQERLVSDCNRKQADLVAEREEQRSLAESRAVDVDRCRSALASCQKTEEVVRTSVAPSPSAHPPPAGSSPPAAGAAPPPGPAGTADGH
jgi:eukaryotic-like serine/threonine-protein kinase